MIELKNVIPLPLLENGLNLRSEVFNTEGVQFEQGKNYLISAASGKGKSTLIHATTIKLRYFTIIKT
jgi:ABC-type lipoprotein export system ATPase subunit